MSVELPPATTLAEAVAPLVGPYVARQRWGRHDQGGENGAVAVEAAAVVQDEPSATLWLLARIGEDLYQLLVGLCPPEEAPDLGERDILGPLQLDGQALFAYEGRADAETVRRLARTMGVPGVDDVLVRPVGAEQSNSSVVLGESVILKLFRRLQPGPNPDVEVTTGLDAVGFNHLASPLGVWRQEGFDYDLAVAQEFLAGGAEGWALALTSLRDLYACEDDDPAAAGGDFASEARRIGEMTGRMHVALGKAFGLNPPVPEDWAAALLARVDQVGPDADVARRARELADQVRRMAADAAAVPSIRVHGDLHLGQVMRTDAGWFVLDFEGEPARAVAERRLPWPAAKDVTGMLRSFAYAAGAALQERQPDEREELLGRAEAWEARNRAAFLDGYQGVDGLDEVVAGGKVGSEADTVLMEFFELDKALYEVAYERAHRPDWEWIPLVALERLGKVR